MRGLVFETTIGASIDSPPSSKTPFPGLIRATARPMCTHHSKLASGVAEEEGHHPDPPVHVAPLARHSPESAGLMVEMDRGGSRWNGLAFFRSLPGRSRPFASARPGRTLRRTRPSTTEIALYGLVIPSERSRLLPARGAGPPERSSVPSGLKASRSLRLTSENAYPAFDVGGAAATNLGLALFVVVPELQARASGNGRTCPHSAAAKRTLEPVMIELGHHERMEESDQVGTVIRNPGRTSRWCMPRHPAPLRGQGRVSLPSPDTRCRRRVPLCPAPTITSQAVRASDRSGEIEDPQGLGCSRTSLGGHLSLLEQRKRGQLPVPGPEAGPTSARSTQVVSTRLSMKSRFMKIRR